MNRRIIFGILATFLLSFSAAGAQTGSCLSLGTDLYPGDKNESVRFLQNFLVQKGYLSAVPNGVYGPATTAAVRAFQKAYNISQTGNVGPMTRSTMQSLGCASLPSTSPSPTPTPTVTPAPPTTVGIASPAAGDILMIGKKYTINWNVAIPYLYDIVLDKSDGSSGGFILHNGSGGNSYEWRAGSTFTALGDQTIATGTYRVRIQPVSGITSSSNPVSGWFTISAPPVVVTSMNPSSAAADGRQAVVLFGSGFDTSSRVRLDGEYGQLANTLYASPDGTVIVFTIPTNVSWGRHALFVNNQSLTPQQVGSIIVTN